MFFLYGYRSHTTTRPSYLYGIQRSRTVVLNRSNSLNFWHMVSHIQTIFFVIIVTQQTRQDNSARQENIINNFSFNTYSVLLQQSIIKISIEHSRFQSENQQICQTSKFILRVYIQLWPKLMLFFISQCSRCLFWCSTRYCKLSLVPSILTKADDAHIYLIGQKILLFAESSNTKGNKRDCCDAMYKINS